jgi:hypothetical protein
LASEASPGIGSCWARAGAGCVFGGIVNNGLKLKTLFNQAVHNIPRKLPKLILKNGIE